MKMHILLFLCLLLVFVVAYILMLPSVKPPPAVSEKGYFSETELRRLKDAEPYHRSHRVVSLAGFICKVLLLLLLLLGPGRVLEGWLFKTSRPILSAFLFFCILYLAYFLLSLPFSYISGVVIEREYGFLKMSTPMWFLRQLKSGGITFIIGAFVVVVLFLLIKHFERLWWLPATGFIAAASLFFAFISPVLIEPLFAKLKPLDDEALHTSLVDVAHRAGFRVKEILVSDESTRTSHTNAYFSGLGRTRRIVLYDTLFANFTHSEIRAIVAHEAGHAKHRHILKGLVLSWLGVAAFLCFLALLLHFYRTSGEIRFVYQPRVVAFLALWALSVSFLSSPLNNLMSRRMEVEADTEALCLTDDADSFISLQKKLSLSNLSELHPPTLVYAFYYTHPTTLERIALAERYRRESR